MDDLIKFKEQVISAFAAVRPNHPLINHECEECLDLQRSFAGKTWRDISPQLIAEHFSDLSLFSAEAFHAFIPAYLIHSIENLDGDDMVSEFTAYAFLPDKLVDKDDGHGNWWKFKLSFFTAEQFALILKYLDLVERTDESFDRSLMKRGRRRLLKFREASLDQSEGLSTPNT